MQYVMDQIITVAVVHCGFTDADTAELMVEYIGNEHTSLYKGF